MTLDILYLYDKLFKVKNLREAETFVRELDSQTANFSVGECGDPNGLLEYFCYCLYRKNPCISLVSGLHHSICAHFLSLELPMSIFDGADELGKLCNYSLPSKIFERVPNIDFLLRYLDHIRPDYLERCIFRNAVDGGHVDFCREILVRGLIKDSKIIVFSQPSLEMMNLLSSYGKTVEIFMRDNGKGCDYNSLEKVRDDREYKAAILQNLVRENKDMLSELRGFAEFRGPELFYAIVYRCYFVEGVENARDYFPDRF